MLAGPRVALRPIRPEDAPGIFAYGSDPAVTEYLTWDTHQTLADAERFVHSALADKTRINLIIDVGGAIAGCVGLSHVGGAFRTAELGYVLHRDFWGRGLALEAAQLLAEHGFETLHLNRIEALCAVPNTRSARVLEKLGMRQEGTLREYRSFHGRFYDMALYSVLRREWRSPPASQGA